MSNAAGNDDFKLVVFDLYDYIIDTLEKEGFLDQCYRFEDRRGIDRIVKAVGNLLCVNDDDSLIVRHIEENTPENAIVFLTGIGKCYPLLRSHKVLNNLSQSFGRVPVVLFFPGTISDIPAVNLVWFVVKCVLFMLLTLTAVKSATGRLRIEQALSFFFKYPTGWLS